MHQESAAAKAGLEKGDQILEVKPVLSCDIMLGEIRVLANIFLYQFKSMQCNKCSCQPAEFMNVYESDILTFLVAMALLPEFK